MATSARFLCYAVVVAVLGGTGQATAASPPFCDNLALSPRFTSDRTAFCVGLQVDGAGSVTSATVGVTRDAGVTWSVLPATGLAVDATTSTGAVMVSPDFANDRTVFVQNSRGLFRSADAGASFQLVDPLIRPAAGAYDDVVVYLDSSALPLADSSRHAVVAYAGGDQSRRVDPPLSHPVVAAPGYDLQPVIAPNGTGSPDLYFLTAENDPAPGASRPYRDALYLCDRMVTCAERRTQFPSGWYAERVWAGTPVKGSTPLYVQLRKVGTDHVVEIRRSTDGGRTFVPWAPMNALLAPLVKAGATRPAVWVAEQPGVMYARIAHGGSRSSAASAPSNEQLHVSRDGGRTWRLVATNGYGSPRAPGRLGWTGSDLRIGPRIFAAGDRLFALGETATFKGVYCSVDGGRRWATTCPRARR